MPTRIPSYTKTEVGGWPLPNYWDWIALLFVLLIVATLSWGAHAMGEPLPLGRPAALSLDPAYLPYYALRTVIRMLIALCFSLLFTFVMATWAAKSRYAERIIIPMIDVLQSVPVLGFLTVTVPLFIALFPGSLLGAECAAIFAIFTAQAWNIALSFYQSMKTLPLQLKEAAAMFQLSAWQRFWRLEVPFAMPGLVWNVMLSMSSSWIFLVAAEAISVANQQIRLPGIGSYIALAIERANQGALLAVIVMMLIVITIYDQLLFRPLVAWSEKFRTSQAEEEEEPDSWVLNLFQRTRTVRYIGLYFSHFAENWVNFPWFRKRHTRSLEETIEASTALHWVRTILWNVLMAGIVIGSAIILVHFVFEHVSVHEALHVVYLGCMTALRVLAVLLLSSIIWVPIGVWIGLSPRAAQLIQPVVQFLAAFPANLLFPLIVMLIIRFHWNVNIGVMPLMMMGSQWYILFNVIAGTIALPKALHHAVGTLQVHGGLWWRRFVLPGIFPYYITGAITAAGATWNITIIAEAVQWGHTQLWATGLGSYITRVSIAGDFPRLALGISVMSLFVLAFNRFVWRRLYKLSEERYLLL